VAHAIGGEARPYIGAALTANLADKPVRVRPTASVHYYRVAAFVIGAKDNDAANARLSHFSEGDHL
jgi:hypothetical protein